MTNVIEENKFGLFNSLEMQVYRNITKKCTQNYENHLKFYEVNKLLIKCVAVQII